MIRKSSGIKPKSKFKLKSGLKLKLKLKSKSKYKFNCLAKTISVKAVPLAFAYSGNGFTPFDNRLKPENKNESKKSDASGKHYETADRKTALGSIDTSRNGGAADRLTTLETDSDNAYRSAGKVDADRRSADAAQHKKRVTASKPPNTRMRVNRGAVIGAVLLLISVIISVVDISMYKSAEVKMTEMTCSIIESSESYLPSEFFETSWYGMQLSETKAAEYEAAYREFVDSYFGKRSGKSSSGNSDTGLIRDQVIKRYSDYVSSQCTVILGSVRLGTGTGGQAIKCEVVKLAPGRARITATFALNVISKGTGNIPFAFGELPMGIRTEEDGYGMITQRLNVVFTAEFSYGIGGTHAEYVNVHKQIY